MGLIYRLTAGGKGCFIGSFGKKKMGFVNRKMEHSSMKLERLILFGAGFLVFLFGSSAAQQLFDSWVTYGIDKQPRSVQSADMDADGDLDLVIGHFQGRAGLPTVIVMENDGAGFFSLRHTLYPASQSGPVVSVDVFDLDGDGDLEILTAHPPTQKVNLFRNLGASIGFDFPLECRAGFGTIEVTAGFLDGDGFPEVLAANQAEGTISIYKNRGSAAFPAESIKVVGIRPRSLVLFDMDDDADNDIAVSVAANPTERTEGFNGFVLFENQGNGVIDDSARVLYKIANPPAFTLLDTILNPFKILAADFNNDNFLDLAVACSASVNTPVAGRNLVCVFLNRQDGTFDTLPALSKPGRYPVGFGARSITAADVDADGDQDIVSANQNDGTVSVLKNNGNGTFAAKIDFLTPNNPPSVVSGGDYDGDGDYDLAIVSLNGASFAVMRNKGDGSFEVGTEFSTSSASEPFGIACGDLDGDGDMDLAAALFTRPQISVHLNTGPGSFPATPPLYVTGGGPIAITMADLDGDLDLDLAVANRGSSDISTLRNNGNGTFAAAVNYSTGPGSFPVDISARDLDGDGDADLTVANSGTSNTSIFKNNGNGTFAPRIDYPTGPRTNSIAIADLDGDGDFDLATADQGFNDLLDSVSVLFNDGSGAFPTRTAYLAGSGVADVTAADLDGDGDFDLAATVPGTQVREDTAMVVFLNNGNGTFAPGVRYLPAPGPVAIAAVDVNGDGFIDILTADSARSAVSIFAGNGTGTFAPSTEYGCGISPRGMAVCDLNGDGDLDLAVTNLRMVSQPTHGGLTILRNQTITPGFLRGDINGDNIYNLVDITQQCNCIFLATGVCTPALSDVNCDGGLSPVDVILLLRKVFIAMPFPC